MQKIIEILKSLLNEIGGSKKIDNLFKEITSNISEYLEDDNIIGLYVETNVPNISNSHDSFELFENEEPYASLIAVYDKQDDKYQSVGNIVNINIMNSQDFGNYNYSTFYLSADNFNIEKNKSYLGYRASASLIRGIIIYDKFGILTEAQEKLPELLNNDTHRTYNSIQDSKINKTLSKKLPIIGI